jgi:hypothetical protein
VGHTCCRRLACLLVFSAATAGPAFAQLQGARIVGTIYDPQRAGIPGATVTVTNVATNLARIVVTDHDGSYVVTPLDPGTYKVTAAISGFQTTVREGVELTVGQAARVELVLALSGVSAEVLVTTQAPLLNTESATLSQVITNEQIVDLPLNGRSFHELARLTPGVALLAPSGNSQLVRPEIVNGNIMGGVSGRQTRFLLDGVDITEEHQGGTWIQTSVDALQEFSVQQNAYSAEFHGAGGTFNVVTKSGSNRVRGSAFEFLRNDAFDAKNYFAQTKEKLERNQFGGTLGGPLVIPGVLNGRDRTFFFASYEGQRRKSGAVDVAIVPSAAQRQGNFQGLNRIYDPLTTSGTTRTQFDGNVIPAGRIASAAAFFLRYIPLPNGPNNTWVSSPVTQFHQDQVTLRVDRQMTDRHKLFVRFSRHSNHEERPSTFPELGATELWGPAFNLAGALTSNFGTSLVHELRISRMYGEYRSTAYFQGEGANLLAQAGVRGLELAQDPAISSLPAFSFSGYAGFSGNAGDGRPKWQNRGEWEITDNLTWLKGRHILKFGGRAYRRKILFTDARDHNGTYGFTGVMTQNPAASTGTGDSFADFLLGYPANSTRSNPATWWGGYGTYWHGFFQDDVKVTNRLTLNLGIRYEYTPWLTGYRGQAAAFDPSRAKPIIVSSKTDTIDLSSQRLADAGYALFSDLIQTSSQAGVPLNLTKNDKRQIGPRLGFAYRPFGENTVLRGGYGIFYEAEGTDGRLNFNFIPFRISETVTAAVNAVPTRTLGDFWQSVPVGASLGSVTWVPLPLEAKPGRDQRWNLGFQRQLFRLTALEVDYVGTTGDHQGAAENINLPPAGAGSVQARRPYPRFGNVSLQTQAQSSDYHALQLKVQQRPWMGLWYLVSYTYSNATRTVPAPEIGGNFTYEHQPQPWDIRHLLAASYGYNLPFGKGRRFLSDAGAAVNAIVGGWQFQNIINYRSGLPYTPTISRDVANIGVGGQRPNRVASGALAQPTIDVWFDKAAFVVPDNFTFGNSGPGILRSDHQWNADASLFKRFETGGGRNVELRAEVFNLLNSVYFSGPNTNVDTAAGGRVTSTSNAARQVQFGLKYIF